LKDELETFERNHGTKLIHVLSEPPDNWGGHIGRIDSTLVSRIFDPARMKGWLFVLCGPPAMMEAVESTLIELGVPATQILSERFDYD
jgi:NAD(P)H-flavin reductase